jgi:hypothetical protein
MALLTGLSEVLKGILILFDCNHWFATIQLSSVRFIARGFQNGAQEEGK